MLALLELPPALNSEPSDQHIGCLTVFVVLHWRGVFRHLGFGSSAGGCCSSSCPPKYDNTMPLNGSKLTLSALLFYDIMRSAPAGHISVVVSTQPAEDRVRIAGQLNATLEQHYWYLSTSSNSRELRSVSSTAMASTTWQYMHSEVISSVEGQQGVRAGQPQAPLQPFKLLHSRLNILG